MSFIILKVEDIYVNIMHNERVYEYVLAHCSFYVAKALIVLINQILC